MVDNYIVMTYYQLMCSIALTLKNNNKSRLFIASDYLNMDYEIVEKIEAVSIFDEVVIFSEAKCVDKFYESIEHDNNYEPENIKKTLFDIFNPLYQDIFKNCQTSDNVYVFNEMQLYYYYIENFFDSIIKVEDGYNSFAQELSVHRFVGKREIFYKIEGNGFPILKSKSPKIKKIIISEMDDRIDKSYHHLLEIQDMKKIFEDETLDFKELVKKVFSLENIEIPKKSIIIITQPLARAKYCTIAQQYKVYEKICRQNYEDYQIYIKPHPADKVKYQNLDMYGAVILSEKFPIDLFNYIDIEFEKGYTFGSTSISGAKYIKNSIVLFEEKDFQVEDIENFIEDYIADFSRIKISYLVNITKKDKKNRETIESITEMKEAEVDCEIIITYNQKEFIAELNVDEASNIHLIQINSKNSSVYQRKIAFDLAQGDYIVFADPGFIYPKNLNAKVAKLLKRKNHDVLALGMKQYCNNKIVSERFFGGIKRELVPYFIQNKVIHRNLLRKCSFDEGTVDDNLILYIDMFSQAVAFRNIVNSFVSFESDSPTSLNSEIKHTFDEHLEIISLINEKVMVKNSEELNKKYIGFLIGLIFWNMRFSDYKADDRRRYTEFLESDYIEERKKDFFDIVISSSEYLNRDLGVIEEVEEVKPKNKDRYLKRVRKRVKGIFLKK